MNKNDMKHNYAVVVAGGSGTRLWPVSRKSLPKQIQKLVSDKTLIEETVDRLSGLVPYENVYVSTTGNYAEKIHEVLPKIPVENIVVEPEARGTTAAFALFSETIYRRDPEATVISLASDHAVSDVAAFQEALQNAYDFIESHQTSIALIGIKPNKPDTGLGYIKTDEMLQKDPLVYSVEKFVEKPSAKVAEKYVASGEYYWNAAYYCFKAKTLIDAYNQADPSILRNAQKFLDSNDPADFKKVPIMPHEIELINANLFPLAVVSSDFQWSDIGNWGTLHDLLAELEDDKNIVATGAEHIDVDSKDCMIVVEDKTKLVATVGLDNIVVVDTKDALLVLDKNHTQDIKSVLKDIEQRGLDKYL